MKHFNLSGIICMLSLLLIQSSCSKDDDFTFQFDENGECYYPSISSISKASFEKSVVGYGWKYVSTQEIGANGECLKGEYYADRIGASPHQYYFENSSTIKYYVHMDAYPAFGFLTYTYDYLENVNKVVTYGSTKLQILSVEGDMLRAVEYMAVRSDGEKVYGLSVYKRMSEQELKNCQKAYPVNFSDYSH